MIAQALVEKIWLEAGLNRSYLAEIKQICLPSHVSSSSKALAQLPLLFCELNGGDREQVMPVITACTLLRHAARLLDDVEDGDVKLRKISEPVALNISTGLLFTVGLVLNSLEAFELQPEAASDIRRMFYEELLKVCSGQHLDLTRSLPTLEESWRIAGEKSGRFTGLLCWAGGRVADADRDQLELYRQFGYNLGLLDQIRDDLADLWSDVSHYSDLENGRYGGLPVTYALSVLPEDERQELLTYVADSNKTAEAGKKARTLIIKSGAGIYLMVQCTAYVQQSEQLLAKMALPAEVYDRLSNLLERARLATVEI